MRNSPALTNITQPGYTEMTAHYLELGFGS
jgi:hypothetical protein